MLTLYRYVVQYIHAVLHWVLSALPFPVVSSALLRLDGRISGSVVDSSGAPVPGVAIELFLKSGKKPLLTSKTSADGLYHFIGVRAGDYDLTVEAAGFVKVDVRGLTVDAARETSVAAA